MDRTAGLRNRYSHEHVEPEKSVTNRSANESDLLDTNENEKKVIPPERLPRPIDCIDDAMYAVNGKRRVPLRGETSRHARPTSISTIACNLMYVYRES